jgi:lipid-A-disaccharide synthase
MIIAYRQSALSWMLMRRMGYQPYVGLPNILAGEHLVPEFLQDKATPGALANALLELLHDAGAQRRQVAKFHQIHALLRQDTAQKAAEAVLGVIDAAPR